jgi:hypothetical protein
MTYHDQGEWSSVLKVTIDCKETHVGHNYLKFPKYPGQEL